jgi:hypothetical protein
VYDCNLRIEGERAATCKKKAQFFFYYEPLTGHKALHFCTPCSFVAMEQFETLGELPSTAKMKPITREEYE